MWYINWVGRITALAGIGDGWLHHIRESTKKRSSHILFCGDSSNNAFFCFISYTSICFVSIAADIEQYLNGQMFLYVYLYVHSHAKPYRSSPMFFIFNICFSVVNNSKAKETFIYYPRDACVVLGSTELMYNVLKTLFLSFIICRKINQRSDQPTNSLDKHFYTIHKHIRIKYSRRMQMIFNITLTSYRWWLMLPSGFNSDR